MGVAPYSWSIAAGTLPPGLDLGEDGLLTGTPGVQGAYTFTVAATDARGVTGSQELTLWVVGPSGGVEVELTPGVPDGGAYGHGYGSDSHETELVVTWQDTGADVSLEVTGYDIDWNDEVAVELNGVRIGYLRAGANNAHTAVNVFQIPAASQLPGRNEIVFRQRVAGWLWGVTGLLLSP